MTYVYDTNGNIIGSGFVRGRKGIGRVKGTKNKETAKRDAAVLKVRDLVEGGMSKIEASNEVRQKCKLMIEAETLARLV